MILHSDSHSPPLSTPSINPLKLTFKLLEILETQVLGANSNVETQVLTVPLPVHFKPLSLVQTTLNSTKNAEVLLLVIVVPVLRQPLLDLVPTTEEPQTLETTKTLNR